MVDSLYIFATYPCIIVASLGICLVYGMWFIHLLRAHINTALIPLVLGVVVLAGGIAVDHLANLYTFLITEANSRRPDEWIIFKTVTKLGYIIGLLLVMFTYWKIRLQLVSWGIPRCTFVWLVTMAGIYIGSLHTIDWLRGVIKCPSNFFGFC